MIITYSSLIRSLLNIIVVDIVYNLVYLWSIARWSEKTITLTYYTTLIWLH